MNHSEIIAAGIGHPITNMLMSQAASSDMSTADHADAGAVVHLVEPASGVSGHATEGAADQVDQVRAAGDDLADHLLEIENLVEGARDAIVRRLEQFDQVVAGVDRIEGTMIDRLVDVESKLDLLLSHFGLAVNTGS